MTPKNPSRNLKSIPRRVPISGGSLLRLRAPLGAAFATGATGLELPTAAAGSPFFVGVSFLVVSFLRFCEVSHSVALWLVRAFNELCPVEASGRGFVFFLGAAWLLVRLGSAPFFFCVAQKGWGGVGGELCPHPCHLGPKTVFLRTTNQNLTHQKNKKKKLFHELRDSPAHATVSSTNH